jgi:hypothetical protein
VAGGQASLEQYLSPVLSGSVALTAGVIVDTSQAFDMSLCRVSCVTSGFVRNGDPQETGHAHARSVLDVV